MPEVTGSPVYTGVTVPGGLISLASAAPDPVVSVDVFRHPDYATPVATLTGLSDYQWQDRVGETGSGSVTIPNSHPDHDVVQVDDLLRVTVHGHAAFTFVVNDRTNQQHTTADSESPATTYTGLGHVGLLSEMVVFPSRGPGSLPIETDRLFSWPSPRYDDTTWVNAAVMAMVADAQNGAWPHQPMGEGFPPNAGAAMIWAPGTTNTSAPEGTCYLRHTYTSAAAGRQIMYVLIDNYGTIYFDGVKILDVSPHDGFTNVHTVVLDASAGQHTIAVWAENAPGYIGDHPAGVAVAIYDADANNQPTSPTPVVVTDSSWKILPYPPSPPGMTAGEVLIILIEEAQFLGVLPGWTWSFTGHVDSAGTPWPVVGDIATKVGTDVATFVLDELAQTYCDVRAQPGGLVLDAYVPGGLGSTPGVDLHAATDPNDPASGNLTDLAHRTVASAATAFLTRWQGGWRFVPYPDTPPDTRPKVALLGLGALPSTSEVDRVAGQELVRKANPRAAITAGFHAPTLDVCPYIGFQLGDRVTVPAEDGTPTLERVLGISARRGGSDAPVWALELVDVIHEQWERDSTALKKLSDGTLRGDARPAQPVHDVANRMASAGGVSCCPPSPGWTISTTRQEGPDSDVHTFTQDTTMDSLTVTGAVTGEYEDLELVLYRNDVAVDTIQLPITPGPYSIDTDPGLTFNPGDLFHYRLEQTSTASGSGTVAVNFEVHGATNPEHDPYDVFLQLQTFVDGEEVGLQSTPYTFPSATPHQASFVMAADAASLYPTLVVASLVIGGTTSSSVPRYVKYVSADFDATNTGTPPIVLTYGTQNDGIISEAGFGVGPIPPALGSGTYDFPDHYEVDLPTTHILSVGPENSPSATVTAVARFAGPGTNATLGWGLEIT